MIFFGALAGALVLARPEPVLPQAGRPPRSALASAATAEAIEADPAGESVMGEQDPPEEPRHGYSLTRMDLEGGLLKVRSRAIGCRNGSSTPPLIVKLTISPSGSVSSVSTPHDYRDRDVAECVARVLRGAGFPAWSAPPVPAVEWTYYLRFDTGE